MSGPVGFVCVLESFRSATKWTFTSVILSDCSFEAFFQCSPYILTLYLSNFLPIHWLHQNKTLEAQKLQDFHNHWDKNRSPLFNFLIYSNEKRFTEVLSLFPSASPVLPPVIISSPSASYSTLFFSCTTLPASDTRGCCSSGINCR